MADIWTGGGFTTDQRIVALGQGSVPKARVDRDGRPKLAPDGRATFSTGCAVLTKDVTGELVPARGTVSLHVIEPLERYGANAVTPTVFVSEGTTWVVPYVSNGFTALSVVTERLVPHKVLGDGSAK